MMAIYSYEYDSQNYFPAAPTVEIGVLRPSTDGPEETITALIDSGADATMLPISVLEKLRARFLETRQMRGATGHRVVVETYLVKIRFGPHMIFGVQAVAMREEVDAVVGRDVLNQLEIVLNGPANMVEVIG